jgi:hypothetical protein
MGQVTKKRESEKKYDREKGVGDTRCSGTGMVTIVHLRRA